MNSFENRLKKIMGDMSVRKFAEKLGVPTTTLQQYLKGRTPPADFIVLVCERYEIDSWWLLTGEEGTGRSGEGMTPMPGQSQSLCGMVQQQGDAITEQIIRRLGQMSEDQRRDVLKYAEEKQLLAQLMAERQR